MKQKRTTLAALALLVLTGCQSTGSTEAAAASPAATAIPAAESTSAAAVFALHSDSLVNGVWDDAIASVDDGEDMSPELDWPAVDGAAGYAVYMIDPDGGDWLHWLGWTSETELAAGADIGDYIGPYPPSGTHTYVVYVFALQTRPETLPGSFDAAGNAIDDIRAQLDSTGTILAEASLSGTYSRK